MTAAQLRNSILQEAISGRLVPQDPNDGSVSTLLEQIRSVNPFFSKFDNQSLEWEYEIPASWAWIKLGALSDEIKRGKSPIYVKESQYIAFAQK